MRNYKAIPQAYWRLDDKRLFYVMCFSGIFNSLEMEERTGIPRADCCRYKRYFQKRKMLFVVGDEVCQITRRKTQFYTTNAQIRDNHDTSNK